MGAAGYLQYFDAPISVLLTQDKRADPHYQNEVDDNNEEYLPGS